MADEHNFPTAIIPTRPEGQRARFRKLAEAYCDPMEKLFDIAKSGTRNHVTSDGIIIEVEDKSLQKEAAKELMQYGYRKQAAAGGIAGLLGLGDGEDGESAPAGFSLSIHFASSIQPPAIDVTPPRAALPVAAVTQDDPDLEEMLR